MFRKLILSAVLATSTVTGLALTPTAADAHPPIMHRFERFEVIYLRGVCWENGGVYRNRFEAERAAEQLRCHGFRVEIRGC
jgi:hypothetical protein